MNKNIKIKSIIIAFLFVFFAGNTVLGQSFKKSRLSLNVSLASMYDDNILKYSDKYLERFVNNEDNGRFELKTYDDVFLKTKISTSYSFRFFKKKNTKTKVSATFFNNYYINNPVKTWNYYGVGVQQYLNKASVKFSYSYIPAFYVRQFRQYDLVDMYGYEPITFKPYVFSKDNYSLTFQNTFYKKTKVVLDLDKAVYYHNKYYTEYDSKNLSAGLNIEQKFAKNYSAGLGYVFTHSDAKGFDEIGETKETADDSDATFNDNTFVLSLKAKLPRVFKKRNDISIKGKYSDRKFSSSHLIHHDALHVNRVDKNIRLYVTYNVKLNKDTKVSLYYNNFFRDTYNNMGIYDDMVSEEKDYKQNQFGFQVSYSIF